MIHPAWRFTHVPLGEVRDPVPADRLQFAGPDRPETPRR